MKKLILIPLLLVAACSDNNATKEESVQIFAAASSALGSAQAKAVDDARARAQLTAPAELAIDFSGPCTFGGTVSLRGTYVGDDNDDRATFDLDAEFDNCREIGGTIDGGLVWTSVASSSGFAAELRGGLDWEGNDADASCDFDMELAVNATGVAYDGSLCGYDVRAELSLDK
jgi:hypothetical protein